MPYFSFIVGIRPSFSFYRIRTGEDCLFKKKTCYTRLGGNFILFILAGYVVHVIFIALQLLNDGTTIHSFVLVCCLVATLAHRNIY